MIFSHLTDLSFNRDWKQAIGFYIAYFVAIVLLAGVLGAVLGLATGNDSFDFGFSIGNIVAIVCSLGLAFAVLVQKNLTNQFSYLLLALLAGVLAVFSGAIGGLIPAAFFTTRKSAKKKKGKK